MSLAPKFKLQRKLINYCFYGRHDIQHYDIQDNDAQHDDTKHDDT
jgi:hypothetical protein